MQLPKKKKKKIVNKVRRLGSFSAFLTEYSKLLLLALHDKTLMALLAYFLYLYTVHTEWGDFLTPLLTLGLLFFFGASVMFPSCNFKNSQRLSNSTKQNIAYKSHENPVPICTSWNASTELLLAGLGLHSKKKEWVAVFWHSLIYM